MDKEFKNQYCFNVFKIDCDMSFERFIFFNQTYFREIKIMSLNNISVEIQNQINYDGFEDEFNNYIEDKIFKINKLFDSIVTIEEFEEFNSLFNSLKQNIKKNNLKSQIYFKYITLNYNLLKAVKNKLNKKKRDLNLKPEPNFNRLKNISTTKFILNKSIGYDNTVKLRNDLIQFRLIDKKQPSVIFYNVFRGYEINKKINWTGTKGDLGLFIKTLKKYDCILNINPYIIAKNAFTLDGIQINSLRDPKKIDAEKYFEKIEKIVIKFQNSKF
ncbi:hypothetical protein [Flavobacterium terrigena]|uniref:Uncharacterized protein n=1 Tax=Flavobacterium terrigena TaxID=402734 RepID=A0A1H6XBW6_9FLAO|nr:hypothetical protein [Flavobacterium terrigena]SEJ26643.1 hypothetical protein SAMN05660918_2802 [Flavobacterium terrigena]